MTFSPSTWSTRLAVKCGFYSGNQKLFPVPYSTKCIKNLCDLTRKLCVTSLSARYATSGARQICVRRKWTNTHILSVPWILYQIKGRNWLLVSLTNISFQKILLLDFNFPLGIQTPASESGKIQMQSVSRLCFLYLTIWHDWYINRYLIMIINLVQGFDGRYWYC